MIDNFRDISFYNNKIKSNFIFRSSELPSISSITYLQELKIENIIDLRTQNEISENDYSHFLPKNISYFNIPIQTKSAENRYLGTPMESVYQYFANDCRYIFANIFKIIHSLNTPFIIHCKHGMDRTGVVVALIHLLCNTEAHLIKSDYLESKSFVQQSHIVIFLALITKFPSIENYLCNNNLNLKVINQIKTKLTQI